MSESDKNKVEESTISLLDIPGIKIGLSDEDDEEMNPTEPELIVPSTSGVCAIPSGSGMTFLLDSSLEADPDDPREVIGQELMKMERNFQNQDEYDMGADENINDDVPDINTEKKRELTDKFLAGQLSFTEFVREFSDQGSEGEEEMSEDNDEEWQPPTPKSSKKPTRRSKGKNDNSGTLEGEDLNESPNFSRKEQLGSTGGLSKRKKRLDPALKGLMGEANLRFVRGDYESAIKMCMEVIRQDPTAPEPFQTLSNIYEESGEQEKCLEFAVLAAHLTPNNSEEWARLADMSLELEDPEQAAMCYRKAIDADLENIQYHLARCSLLEQIGNEKAALRGYKRLLWVLKEDQGIEYLQTAKEVARLLHQRHDVEGAKNAIKDAVKRHPNNVGHEDINLLLELMISLEQNEEALEILCEHVKIQFTSSHSQEKVRLLDSDRQLQLFQKVFVPEETPLDICSKLIVILINLKSKHLVEDHLPSLLSSNPEEFGDLMLDVAEAFINQNCHIDAIQFLEKLVHSEEYGKAAVWLKYGECLFETNNLELAEKAYQTVVNLAPNHHDAIRTLSNILHKLGRAEDAIHLLTQDEAAELLNPTLLYEKCQLLLAEGCIEEFISKAKLLLSRHFTNIKNRDEAQALISVKKLSLKNRALSDVRTLRKDQTDEKGPSFKEETQICVQDEFELFNKLCHILHEQQRFPELQRICFSAMGSPSFNKNLDIIKECEFLCLLSAFLNGDSFFAFNLIRDLMHKNVNNNRLWNLFNLVISRSEDQRHNRFLMRMLSKNQDVLALGILNGHNCLVAGTYKYTLGEYMSAFKMDPENPLLALLLGLTFLHMACQKFSAKKHSLVVQGCAFLNQYLHLRGKCQESYYNLGRAMHQLGLLPGAIHYYKKCLETKPSLDHSDVFNLQREAAHNLCLIYKNSGSYDMARYLIEKHIVI